MTEMQTIRQALGLSQAELAKKLGLHQSTISRFESGALAIDKRTSLALKSLVKPRARRVAAATPQAERAAA